MAMVSMNNLLNGKDSRWLQLEVCREFQRNKCTRPDTECKFAHPPANVEVQNGRVTACYDSIKVTNRCIIEFSYSRVTSAFARSEIVGPRAQRTRPINSAFTYLTPSVNSTRELSLLSR
ncbi:Protein muscleblind [Atta colombica]|uniref:Protein muscleblind n=2 Tax=Attini TaxID=143999 RepID=A0A195BV22_9HYME|nr:Protein muscleblind [Atta colombica]KYN19984.1 Protein muscleblind [Trachymyrmex cornetzi]